MTFIPKTPLENRLFELIVRYEESGSVAQYRQWQETVLLDGGRPISVDEAIRRMEAALESEEGE